MYTRMIEKKISYHDEKFPLQAKFVMKKNALQARLIKQNAPQARFLNKSWYVLCPIDIVCNLFSTNHSSESSFFN